MRIIVEVADGAVLRVYTDSDETMDVVVIDWDAINRAPGGDIDSVLVIDKERFNEVYVH